MPGEYQRINHNLNTNIHPTFRNFENNDDDDTLFDENRSVGKSCYMAPEVMYNVSQDGTLRCYRSDDEYYDARKADIWTLGIILFSMCSGAKLYRHPSRKDKGFKCAFEGDLRSYIVETLKLGPFVTEDILDLLNKIFIPAEKRMTMQDLLQHPFVRLIDNDDDGLCENMHLSSFLIR